MADIEKTDPSDHYHADFSHFTVGPVIVDSLKNSLINEGVEQLIEPRLMRLLILLARNQGTPVHRDDLLAEISDTAYPSDEALTQAISKLRRALGDQTKSPVFIKTVPKRGYMLIAPVQVLSTIQDQSSAAEQTPRQPEKADQPSTAPSSKQVLSLPLHIPTIWFVIAVLAVLITGYHFLTKDDVQFIEKGDIEFIEKKKE